MLTTVSYYLELFPPHLVHTTVYTERSEAQTIVRLQCSENKMNDEFLSSRTTQAISQKIRVSLQSSDNKIANEDIVNSKTTRIIKQNCPF